MATNVPSERKLREIEEIAAGWGKLLARESFPERPGLDVSLADMEDIVARATKAIIHGAVETMTADQAQQLGDEAACPGWWQDVRTETEIPYDHSARRQCQPPLHRIPVLCSHDPAGGNILLLAPALKNLLPISKLIAFSPTKFREEPFLVRVVLSQSGLPYVAEIRVNSDNRFKTPSYGNSNFTGPSNPDGCGPVALNRE